MNEIDIEDNTIHWLRERRIALLEEIDKIDDELKGLDVNPHLNSLIVSILKAASRSLASAQLFEHTLALGIHAHTLFEFNRHLDRLHAAGAIQLSDVGDGSTWIRAPFYPAARGRAEVISRLERMDLTLISGLGAKKPDFNAEVHPEILMRMLMLGYSQVHIAEVMGIDISTLERWLAKNPQMRVAERRAAAADSEVALSVFYMAIGHDPVSGDPKEPDLKAAMFWLKCRADWKEATTASIPAKSVRGGHHDRDPDLSVSELQSTAAGLVSKMQEALDAPPPPTPPPPDADF